MKLSARSRQRPGLSLLEVVISLAVFLFALVAITQLIILGSDRALDIRYRTRAAELCESKLDEIVAGAVPLSSQDEEPCDEDPDYKWSMSAESSNTAGLWTVSVTVSHERTTGSKIQVVLNRMVMDPTLRGNIAVAAAPPTDSTSTTSSSGSSSSSSTSSGSTPSSTSTSSGAAGGMISGGAAPKTTGTGTTGTGKTTTGGTGTTGGKTGNNGKVP